MSSTIVEHEYFTDHAYSLVEAFRDEYHLRFEMLNTDPDCYRKAVVNVALKKHEHWCFIERLFAHKRSGDLAGMWIVDEASNTCISKCRDSIPAAILAAVDDARCFCKCCESGGDADG